VVFIGRRSGIASVTAAAAAIRVTRMLSSYTTVAHAVGVYTIAVE